MGRFTGPTGDPKCPECGNSFGHGIPADRPDLLRCGNCKTIFNPKGVEMKIPSQYELMTPDEIAECVSGITEDTYKELWSVMASPTFQKRARGGDGSDGTTEVPDDFSGSLKDAWPHLSDKAKANIIETVIIPIDSILSAMTQSLHDGIETYTGSWNAMTSDGTGLEFKWKGGKTKIEAGNKEVTLVAAVLTEDEWRQLKTARIVT